MWLALLKSMVLRGNEMKDMNKRERFLLVMVITLAVCLVFIISTFDATRSQRNNLAAQNCSLQEEKNAIYDTNMRLLEALRREHRIALAADTKLLVADLAWLDRENDTFYMDAFIDLDNGEGNCFKRLKKLFDEDEGARARAVNIVCYHLDNMCLYDITSDYYNQLVAESETAEG